MKKRTSCARHVNLSMNDLLCEGAMLSPQIFFENPQATVYNGMIKKKSTLALE